MTVPVLPERFDAPEVMVKPVLPVPVKTLPSCRAGESAAGEGDRSRCARGCARDRGTIHVQRTGGVDAGDHTVANRDGADPRDLIGVAANDQRIPAVKIQGATVATVDGNGGNRTTARAQSSASGSVNTERAAAQNGATSRINARSTVAINGERAAGKGEAGHWTDRLQSRPRRHVARCRRTGWRAPCLWPSPPSRARSYGRRPLIRGGPPRGAPAWPRR